MSKKKNFFLIASLLLTGSITFGANYRVACIPSAAALTGADLALADYYHIKHTTRGGTTEYVCYFKFTKNEPACVRPAEMSDYSYVDTYPGGVKTYPGGLKVVLCLFPTNTHQNLLTSLRQGASIADLGNPPVYGTWERVKEYLEVSPMEIEGEPTPMEGVPAAEPMY